PFNWQRFLLSFYFNGWKCLSKIESSAVTNFTFQLQHNALHVQYFFRNSKTKSCTTKTSRRRRICLCELLENNFLFILWNTDASITYFKSKRYFIIGLPVYYQLYRYFSLVCEFDR